MIRRVYRECTDLIDIIRNVRLISLCFKLYLYQLFFIKLFMEVYKIIWEENQIKKTVKGIL